ncbi:ATPase, F1 complex, OSCP/delta subunit [Corchorus olitorius]|uniref:ATPase, F1 complex, OSCP/delta subunit n=1 Tax=Corchorus olitorius TaxID=93759 RepID=A0A1R3IE49_9ROSI|nr:ATPase, F1 complex, OSCP/delta subunit [Corchorus olitorius]
MAMAGRIRSTLPLFNRLLRANSSSAHRSTLHQALLCPEISRNYATASPNKDVNVKVPLALFGGNGNYASALYIAAVKKNSLDKVESDLLDIVEASKKSPTFSQFTKDLSVPADTRVKAIKEICGQAKLSDVTNNFLVLLAENGRLRYIDSIAKKFVELTMAHKGIVKAIVTTVIALRIGSKILYNYTLFIVLHFLILMAVTLYQPLSPEEEKDLKETLQDTIGQGKQITLEQKIDPSILGGLVVEFGQKVFDMSIKTRAKQMERLLREPVNFDTV